MSHFSPSSFSLKFCNAIEKKEIKQVVNLEDIVDHGGGVRVHQLNLVKIRLNIRCCLPNAMYYKDLVRQKIKHKMCIKGL